ncbi:MAG TPA: hypothetical protein VIU11_26490, partial [Nakamurella sp.]
TGGEATISLPGPEPLVSIPVTLTVRAGIAELVATADPLVADGTPHPVTVTANPADESVTDLGQVRFDAGPGIAISCGGEPSDTATCGFDDGALRLQVTTTTAGPLDIGSVDQGGRTIENNFAELTVLAPASLSLSDLSVAEPLVAGGTGALTLTVTNGGGVDASLGSVTLIGPEGVIVTGVTPSCEGDCIVPAGGSVEVTVTVDVAPTVRDPATLALQVGDLTTDKLQVPVASGIQRVHITPDDDLIADGSTSTLTVTVVSELTDPGPVTLIAPKGVTLTACDERGPSVTCTGPTFAVGITVAVGTTPGPLALTAQDAGLRTLDVTPLTVVAPGPADLRLDVPGGVSVHAGGGGSLSVTVNNSGGSTSPGGESISVTLPKGLTLTGTDIPGTDCNGATQAALAVAAPTAAIAADCTLPPIDRGTDQQVTFFFDATPGAAGGDALVTLADQKPVPVPVTVNAGITGFTADRTTLPADGTAQTVVLAASPAADGLDLGSITVTSDDPAVTVTCGDGGSCPIGGDGTIKLIVTVSEKRAPGSLTLSVKDEGGRTFDVGPFTVLGAAQLSVSELTMNVQPVQGGQGRFSLTVSNSGDLPSSNEVPVTVSAPGLVVDAVTVGGTSICTEKGCALPPVPVKPSVTVVVTVSAPAATKPGTYTVTTELLGQKKSRTFEIAQAASRVIASPAGPYPAGTSPELNLTVQRIGDSSGAVTLKSTDSRVTLRGCGTGGGTLICPANSFPVTVTIDASLPTGPLPIEATDAAGMPVPLRDANGEELTVVGAALQLSELTVDRYNGSLATLELRVSNPTNAAIGSRPIGFAFSSPLVLGQLVEIRGPGSTFDYCGVFSSCIIPALEPQEYVDLSIYVVVPRIVAPATVAVTIDGTTRSATVGGGEPTGTATATSTAPPATTSASPTPTPTKPTPTPTPTDSPTTDPTLDPTTGSAETPDLPPANDVPPTGSAQTTELRPTTGSAERTDLPPATDVPPTTDVPSTTDVPPATDVPPTADVPTTDVPPSTETVADAEPTGTTGTGEPTLTGATTAEEAATTAGTTSEPAPALLSLTGAAMLEQPSADGTGTLTVQVRNEGGVPSAAQAVRVSLPAGVGVASISVDDRLASEGAQSCTLPEIAAGDSVTVLITVIAEIDAEGGPVIISTTDASVQLDLRVQGGAPPAGTVPATEQPAVRKDDATADQPTDTTGGTQTAGP